MKPQTILRFTAAVIFISMTAAFTATAAGEILHTRGEVDFIAGAGPVAPLNPDYPNNNLTDLSDVNITNDNGSLSLNVVPDFMFAQSGGTSFPAQLTGEKSYTLYSPRRPYVQVSDLRGNGGGWKLSVSASQFFADDAPALNGAKIRLLGGTAFSSNNALLPPLVNGSVIIECDGQTSSSVTVVDAPCDNNSMGAWIIRWYPLDGQGRFTESTPVHTAGVDLYIPSGVLALPGNYSATLYWTLSDAA